MIDVELRERINGIHRGVNVWLPLAVFLFWIMALAWASHVTTQLDRLERNQAQACGAPAAKESAR